MHFNGVFFILMGRRDMESGLEKFNTAGVAVEIALFVAANTIFFILHDLPAILHWLR